MRILVDADGCPVVDLTIKIAANEKTECILFCDTSHEFQKEGVKTITVSKGADSVDFALVNLIQIGDIVITQDYGLAAMCLAKRATVLHQNGFLYQDSNIEELLHTRYLSKKLRAAGGRTKGPPKRTKENDLKFEALLLSVIDTAKKTASDDF